MWWKIKRWWLFRIKPAPKVGELLCYYPFHSQDTLRRDVIIRTIKGNFIVYFCVGPDCEYQDIMHYEDFFELFINKKFIESWGVKL